MTDENVDVPDWYSTLTVALSEGLHQSTELLKRVDDLKASNVSLLNDLDATKTMLHEREDRIKMLEECIQRQDSTIQELSQKNELLNKVEQFDVELERVVNMRKELQKVLGLHGVSPQDSAISSAGA